MRSKRDKELPRRKEPGFLGRLFGRLIGFVAWMVMALLVSILIEWAGIWLIWPEEGSRHSRDMVLTEYQYLNGTLRNNLESYAYQSALLNYSDSVSQWFANHAGFENFRRILAEPGYGSESRSARWFQYMVRKYDDYVCAAVNIAQLFCIRLTIILLSLFVFVLFGLVGIADGLTERELRRWGGGRESSTVYNIAKRSVYPAFIIACVVYISFPTTIHPSLIMVPFGMAFGYSLKVTFEKLKKYF